MSDERIDALFAAVKTGDETATLSIVDSDPALIDSYSAGVSPIRAAIYAGNRDLAQKIADRSAMLTLHDAAALGRANQIKHVEGEVNAFSEDGFTPLTLAAAFGNSETVAALILMGADLHLFSTNPNIKVAPIHAAAFGMNTGAIETLVASGADVDLRSEGGFTALHSASQNGDTASVSVLLGSGADKGLRSEEGKTAADYAREQGHDELAAMLEIGAP
ncbi:MAG: ankyrin repeat domain-containing protein [Fimbriimonadales bacterium]